MGQLFVVPSRWEVHPDLPVIGTPIHSQLTPVARGEADFYVREPIIIEVYNPDNDALLYHHAKPVESGGILPPFGKVCGHIDHKLSREVVRDTDKGFATPCVLSGSILPLTVPLISSASPL